MENYQISKVEISITLISMMIGVGILTLPRALAIAVGTVDGWISIIIGSIITIGIASLIVKLHCHFPSQTALQFISSQNMLGTWFAKLLGILFVIYFTTLMAYEVRILTVVVRIYLLTITPSEITAILILIASTYAVTKGVQGIIHLNLLFLPMIMFILVVIIGYSLPEVDLTVLLPIAGDGIMPILKGVPETVLSFLGIEILFFFLAYMKKEDIKVLPLSIGIGVVGSLYILSVILAFTILSVKNSEVITFPFVALAKEVEIIEGLFERLEPIMMAFWIMTIFNTVSIIHLLAVKVIKEEFKLKSKISTVAIWITFFAFIIVFIPDTLPGTFQFGEYISYLGISLSILVILIGYLFILLGKKGKGHEERKVLEHG